MLKFIKWFAPIVTVGVATFIIFFMFSINSLDNTPLLNPLTHTKSDSTKTETKFDWLANFSASKSFDYYYPINEVFIKVELQEEIIPISRYKFLAAFLDPYQQFCLKEELKNHDLKYYLHREKKSLELIIYSQNREKLETLLNVLKNYKISATIELVDNNS